ncbi:Opi1-domain-containing protein [Morchella conica CCBAS932]|uniref:Opi1-domain-containing protein n=1 Tax=Morchella conica CCBAS932 TaxID=1392247 RepID=A0A3N4KF89_9PEZI|nr:Opi1-domain-containing protein [Morchella conica CCBAS932]
MATRTRFKSPSPVPSHPHTPKSTHLYDPTDALSASHFHAQYPHFASSPTPPPPPPQHQQQQYYDPRFSSGSRHPPKKHADLPILSYHNAVPEPYRTQAPVGEPVPVVLPPVNVNLNVAPPPPRYVAAAAAAAPKAPEKSRSLSIQSLISAPAVEPPSYGRSSGGGVGVSTGTAEEQHTRKRKGSDDAGDRDSARGTRHGSLVPTSVSIEDPDVREVVEALGGLKGDFTPTPASPPLAQAPENEPLIDLITHRAHPLLSSAITTSINTYAASKSYSASFRYAAESVENRVGLPVSNVVSAVGRRTGLDGVLRRGLQRSSSSTTPTPAPSSPSPRSDTNKKRKTRNDPHEDSTPTTDDTNGALVQQHQSPESQTWQKRIVLGASGLSVALNEESLKNLKYCLQWLRFLNVHLNKLVTALRSVVEELDNHRPSTATSSSANGVAAPASTTGPPLLPPIYEGQRAALTAKVEGLKAEVVNTMKKVVEVVSNYTGSALPENARDLIKRHIFSLPQRFAAASASAPASNSNQLVPGAAPAEEDHNSPRSTANRVMVLAKEGLDMMQQVSEVVEGTITRAEEWCERLGKRKKEDVEEQPSEEQKRSVSWKERFEGLEERRAVREENEGDGDVRMQDSGR